MNILKNKLKLQINIPSKTAPSFQTSSTQFHSECSQITDNIYLSGYKPTLDEQFLISKGITHIINCAGGSKTFTPIFFKGIHYKTIHLRDDSMNNLSLTIQEFIDHIEFIDNLPNTKILIHCYEGISRAPALVCAYLMYKKKIGFNEALYFVKEKRNCVDINIGFMCQLEKYYFEMVSKTVTL